MKLEMMLLMMTGWLLLAMACVPLGCLAYTGLRSALRFAAWNGSTEAGALFGAKVYFAKNGDTVESVTVSSSTAPAGSVLTTWTELGSIKTFKPKQQRSGGVKIRTFNTTSGQYEKLRTVNEQLEIQFELVIQEVSDQVLALAYGADSVGNGTFTPGSSDGKIDGYLLLKKYDGTTVVLTVKAWGELFVTSGVNAEEAPGDVTLMFDVLKNSNNTGTAAGDWAPA